MSPLSDVGLVYIFSHSVGYHFALLTVSFTVQKLCNFRSFHFLIVFLYVCASGVIFRKWFPMPICSRLLPTFSSMRFSMVGFMLMSLIHLDLSFVHGDFTSQYPVISAPFVEDDFFFPLDNFTFFAKNHMIIGV